MTSIITLRIHLAVSVLLFPLFTCWSKISLHAQAQIHQVQYLTDISAENFYRTDIMATTDGFLLTAHNQLLELNMNGAIRKVSQLDNDVEGNYFKIEQLADGYLFAGTKDDGGFTNVNLTKTDLDFNVLWSKNYTEAVSGNVIELIPGPSLTISPTGEIVLMDHKTFYRIDMANGNIIERRFHDYRQPAAILNIDDAFVIALGDPRSGRDNLIALDAVGNEIWAQRYTVNNFNAIVATTEGFMLSGEKDNSAFLLRTTMEGDSIQMTNLPYRVINALQPSPTGDGFFMTGRTLDARVFLAKVDVSGTIEWEQKYEEGTGRKLLFTDTGGFLIAANCGKYGYVITADEMGNTEPFTRKIIPEAGIIDINNIRTLFHASGLQFFDGNSNGSDDISFSVPKDSNTVTVFAGGIWAGGIDETDNVRVAAQEYLLEDSFVAGTRNDRDNYRRVWNVYQADIDLFLSDFNGGNLSEDRIPFDILTWPAKGNPYARNLIGTTFTIEDNLAPFVDIDENGLYNPLTGDYPLMKGDQMLWWVMSDIGPPSFTSGEPLQLELVCTVYAYTDPIEPLIDNTLFMDIAVTNRSEQDYHDFYLGQWNDFDIGCFLDDNIGSYPAGNFYYAYNKTAIDSDCFAGIESYGENTPVQTVHFLSKELAAFTYFNNAGQGGPPINTTDPMSVQEYYNHLSGLWGDGTPLTAAGYGYQSGGEIVQHAFSGNPTIPEQWSACSVSEEIENFDQRTVGSAKWDTFAADETIQLELSYVTFLNVAQLCPDIEPIADNLKSVNCFHTQGNFSELFTVDLGADTILSTNQPVQLDSGNNGTTWEWSTGETSQTITVNESGNYSVTVTSAGGCMLSDSVFVEVTTSTKTNEELVHFRVYPVPANDVLYFDYQFAASTSPHEIILVDQLGRTIQHKSVIQTDKTNDRAINVGKVASGVYFLCLKNDQGVIARRRVVIF